MKKMKRMKNVPILYDEIKQNYTVAACPSSMAKFDILADSLGLSRSECFEQICRNHIKSLRSAFNIDAVGD